MRFFEHQDEARRHSRALMLGFVLAVAATVAAVHAALVALWALLFVLWPGGLAFPAGFLVTNVGVTLLLIVGGWWIETSNSRSQGGEYLARRAGAREARPALSHAEQRLCNIVDEVAIAAHMPRPQPMVLPRAGAINAFAAGWDPEHAVVAVTQGALDALTREELQGLVAHECSHIHEGDTRLYTQLAGMVFGLELVYRFGDELRERGAFGQFVGTVVMTMGSFGWLAGRVLQAAVSRQREYLADARAVQWCRSRDGLGGVLRKVMTQQRLARSSGPQPDVSFPAVQHMLMVEAGVPQRWLQAHPPLAERVRRLYGREPAAPPLSPDAPADRPTA